MKKNIEKIQIPIDSELISKIIFNIDDGIFIYEELSDNDGLHIPLLRGQLIDIKGQMVDLYQYYDEYKKIMIEHNLLVSITIHPTKSPMIQHIRVDFPDYKEFLLILNLDYATLKNLDIFKFTLFHELNHLFCKEVKKIQKIDLIVQKLLKLSYLILIPILLTIYFIYISTFLISCYLSISYIHKFFINFGFNSETINSEIFTIFWFLLLSLYFEKFLTLWFLVLKKTTLFYSYVFKKDLLKNYYLEIACDQYALKNSDFNLKTLELDWAYRKNSFSYSHPSSSMRFYFLKNYNSSIVDYFMYYYMKKNNNNIQKWSEKLFNI